MPKIVVDCGVANSQVVARLKEIEDKLHSVVYNSVYKVRMDEGLTYYVAPEKHKLMIVRGITVLNTDDKEVIVVKTIQSDRSVRIDSNVDLHNAMLIIF